MKEQALWLYRKLTTRSRNRMLEELRDDGNVPVAVLFYHRVADRHMNPWTISCSDFTQHLDWLQENFDIVSLEEAQRRIQSSYCDRPTVALTFDDGYADNNDFAIPELLRRELTATYFVSTEYIRNGNAFPHDAKANMFLQPNAIADLQEYVKAGIQIGAHSRTHCDLAAIEDESKLRDEIAGSVQDLEDWLGESVDYFAFPFGLPKNTTQAAVDVITKMQMKGFCTAFGAWNWPNSLGTHIRRIHGDPGLARLKNWLTLDSRTLSDLKVPFVEPSQAELRLASQFMTCSM